MSAEQRVVIGPIGGEGLSRWIGCVYEVDYEKSLFPAKSVARVPKKNKAKKIDVDLPHSQSTRGASKSIFFGKFFWTCAMDFVTVKEMPLVYTRRAKRR